MEITSELGNKVIERVAEYIDLDINIMNLTGKIVASTNPVRINQIHSGAIEVIQSNQEIIIDETNMIDYPNTKPGVNLPINHQGKLRGIVGVSGNPNDIIQITGLIRASVEIVIEQIYLERRAGYKEIRWNYWLRELLHPSGFNKKLLEEEAKYSLNIDTEQEWKVIVLTGRFIHQSLEGIKQEVTNRRIEFLFILPFLDHEIVIALPTGFERLDDLLNHLFVLSKHNIKIGVGDKASGINGIRESYLQAKQALTFADKETKIAYSTQFKIKRLTHSIAKKEYNHICLHYEKQLQDLGNTYIKTIDAYFSNNFSIKSTSEALHIHRNTLLYRLDQIKEKVGLDPRSFNDLFILKVIRSRNN